MLALWPSPELLELRYTLQIDEPTPSNNTIKEMHFHLYKNLRRRWQLAILAALGGRKPTEPLPVSFLVVTRSCAGAGLDWDNAYGGLKPLLDCLVAPTARNPSGLGLILDDNPSAMPFPPFVRQQSALKNQGSTKLEIFAISQHNSVEPK